MPGRSTHPRRPAVREACRSARALELHGSAGDQTEGPRFASGAEFEGPVDGRSFIGTRLGGRYGADSHLIQALIVRPDEPIASDRVRARALLADLVRMATDRDFPPYPGLPDVLRRPTRLAYSRPMASFGSAAFATRGSTPTLDGLRSRGSRWRRRRTPAGDVREAPSRRKVDGLPKPMWRLGMCTARRNSKSPCRSLVPGRLVRFGRRNQQL